MEIQRRVTYRQRRRTVHLQSAIYDNRLLALYQRVLMHHHVAHLHGIPGMSLQHQLLLHTALQPEHQLILHQLRLQRPILRCRQFHEHADAVALSHLQIGDHRAQRIIQVRPVHVHAETRLVALSQSDALQPDAVTISVIHPKIIRSRPHGRKHRVHLQRVNRKRQPGRRTRRKRVVVLTAHQGHQYSEEK